ncbi:uncharacterized protein LOC111250640 isoform X1 [Varroa destructor]|uniref:Uncharacterized protein n=1 Tax=Varroa destructor TaxID=109461 RepID=A0A7M7KJB8_VARDE|nr:uncharacterized protein LOC111250640 isoform X1 [Varroa destructor]
MLDSRTSVAKCKKRISTISAPDGKNGSSLYVSDFSPIIQSDVMEAETVFVLAIFSVFFVVGASLFYYACCVTDNEEAVNKLRESLKRKRSRSSIKVATTTSSQFPHSSAITSGPTLREMQSVGIQVVPPTPEVFQPPPEFSEDPHYPCAQGSSSSITPNRTPTPEPQEHRNSIDCSNHSNVLSVLLQEYLNSMAKAKENGYSATSSVSGVSLTDSPRVVHL